ncbi:MULTISPECIES: hypothetical protein [unclassified Microcoleus]|uniref:hypothetical protein n=1 Tax=unclassified Microcoleus TaxID=2642155 RepID=UPI002FD2C3C9
MRYNRQIHKKPGFWESRCVKCTKSRSPVSPKSIARLPKSRSPKTSYIQTDEEAEKPGFSRQDALPPTDSQKTRFLGVGVRKSRARKSRSRICRKVDRTFAEKSIDQN